MSAKPRFAILWAVAAAVGGLALVFGVGPGMGPREAAGLAVGLAVMAGAIALGLRASARTTRSANEDAVRLTAQFARLAERTGLRVLEGEAIDHPIVGRVLGPPALVGDHRGHTLRIQCNVADDNLGELEILVRAPQGVSWPKIGRLRRARLSRLPPSARSALERLEARTAGRPRARSVGVSDTTLRGVTHDELTAASLDSTREIDALEAILDDLIVLAGGLAEG